MILHFPNLDALQLALTSDLVPHAVSGAAVAAGFGQDGGVSIRPAKSLPRAVQRELKPLGVSFTRSSNVALDHHAVCWHQLVPLKKCRLDDLSGQKTPVIFDLPQSEQLPEIVSEILRQGNDRQSFRHLAGGEGCRSLLRVLGAPYYSLLRALDGDGADRSPRAYVQQSSRIWVEAGYQHPLANRIEPPAGKLLLLRPQRDWEQIDEAPFRDIYEAIDFQLPAQTSAWKEAGLSDCIRVPLRLTGSSSDDAATLWVLREDAVEQIDQLVQSSDNHLLSRLAFAVGERDGATVVVLRVRPSKEPPPVMILNGLAMRSYLNLPGLFVPVGKRLHPPIRRDAVARLLSEDRNQIVWLAPRDDGAFVPESISDSAFRPLSDWVDYVLDHEQQALAAWAASHRFDFESFVCRDDQAPYAKGPPKGSREKQKKKDRSRRTPRSEEAMVDESRDDTQQAQAPAAESAPLTFDKPTMDASSDALRERLKKLEEEFLADESPLDSPARAERWREMGAVNAALEKQHDATICWSQHLWEAPDPSSETVAQWLKCERRDAGAAAFSPKELSQWFDNKSIQPAVASQAAAYLVWAARQAECPAPLAERLGDAVQFLQRHESALPARALWLAWVALAQLAQHDVLMLARARDRLLERLFHHGLTPEFDMPAFIRAQGVGDSERFRVVLEQLVHARALVARWIEEPPKSKASDNPQTGAYADLAFAFAMARMGEKAEAQRLADSSCAALEKTGDTVHKWLGKAYAFRIAQAIEGNADLPLSGALMDERGAMDTFSQYKVNKLRRHSRILEPHQRVNDYSHYNLNSADAWKRELINLANLSRADQIRATVQKLYKELGAGDVSRTTQWLTQAIEVSPLVDEGFASELLEQVDATLEQSSDVVECAILLDKALFTAGHFGKAEQVQGLAMEFEKRIPEIISAYFSLNPEGERADFDKLDSIELLVKHSLRSMRKLGMREHVGRIFGTIADLVEAPKTVERDEHVRAFNLLLAVAGGWFYYGQNDRALQMADSVRSVLFKGNLPSHLKRLLAGAYIGAVAQAPSDVALERILELFAKSKNGSANLTGVAVTLQTNSHLCVSQYSIIETAVLSLVNEDFTLSPEGRRWLDEDEFLVRRRVHRDVEQAMRRAEG